MFVVKVLSYHKHFLSSVKHDSHPVITLKQKGNLISIYLSNHSNQYLVFQRRPSAHEVQHTQQEARWGCLVLPEGRRKEADEWIYRNSDFWGHCACFYVSLYLGDVAGTGETKRHRSDRFGHEAHGDLIPTIPHCLDGLADVPVVMSHADVLWTAEMWSDEIRMAWRWRRPV